MELVEILAKELGEWPENIEAISQAGDMQASYYISMDHEWIAHLDDWSRDGYVPYSRFTTSELATDHSTAIVTREMWQAERDKQAAIQVGIDAANNGCLKPLSEVKARYNGPIQWRDRIREIDAQLAGLTLERAERVAELAAEGFALIDKPVEDMSDPSNWRMYDLIEFISDDPEGDFTTGKLYEVDEVSGETVSVTSDNTGEFNGWATEYFKFHSRP